MATYPSIGQKRAYFVDSVRLENKPMRRRNMDVISWAEAFTALAEVRGVRLGVQGRQKDEIEKTATMAEVKEGSNAKP